MSEAKLSGETSRCPSCTGTGKIHNPSHGLDEAEWEDCFDCNGSGWVTPEKAEEIRNRPKPSENCPKCFGYGRVLTGYDKNNDPEYNTCPLCKGTGRPVGVEESK